MKKWKNGKLKEKRREEEEGELDHDIYRWNFLSVIIEEYKLL